jgi:hypothetical protein
MDAPATRGPTIRGTIEPRGDQDGGAGKPGHIGQFGRTAGSVTQKRAKEFSALRYALL